VRFPPSQKTGPKINVAGGCDGDNLAIQNERTNMPLLFSPSFANIYYVGGGSISLLLVIVVVVLLLRR